MENMFHICASRQSNYVFDVNFFLSQNELRKNIRFVQKMRVITYLPSTLVWVADPKRG